MLHTLYDGGGSPAMIVQYLPSNQYLAEHWDTKTIMPANELVDAQRTVCQTSPVMGGK
jgi:hypothetical protein